MNSLHWEVSYVGEIKTVFKMELEIEIKMRITVKIRTLRIVKVIIYKE